MELLLAISSGFLKCHRAMEDDIIGHMTNSRMLPTASPITNASEPKAVNRDSGKDLAELFVMS